MVPVKIWLRNFLSYGDQPQELDLTNIHVAALVGNNGAGKSALLDAICWALFGKARSSNEQLMRKGAKEMSVTLDFEVDGQLFQVNRRFRRTEGAGSQSVTLSQWDGRKWRPICSGVKNVERELARLLNTSYDTFINTVFLPQGQSGSFMDLSPADRRDLLSKGLGLEDYERVAEKAKERARTLQGQIEEGRRRLREIDEALRKRPEAERAFKEKQQEQQKLEQRLQTVEDEIKQLQRHRDALLRKQAEKERLQSTQQQLLAQTAESQQRIADFQKQLKQWQKVLDEEPKIVEAWEKFQQVQQEEARLSEKAEQQRQLEQERSRLEQSIQAAKAALERELGVKETHLASIQKQLSERQTLLAQRPQVEQQLQELHKARETLKALDEKQRQWQTIQQQRTELANAIAREGAELAQKEGQLNQALEQLRRSIATRPQVEAEIQQLNQQRQDLQRRLQQLQRQQQEREQLLGQLSMLQTQREQIEKVLQETKEKAQLLAEHIHEPKCPLCETPLSPQKLAALRRKFDREIREQEEKLQEVAQRIAKTQQDIDTLNRQLQALPQLQQQLASVEQQLGAAQQKLNDIFADEERQKQLKAEFEALKKEKANAEQRWSEAQGKLDEQERQLGYDPQIHQQWRKRVEALAPAEERFAQLLRAEKEAQELEAQIAKLQDEIATLKQRLSANDYAHEERARLSKVLDAIQQLGYNPKRHQAVRAWLQKNQHIPRWWQQLQNARHQVPQLNEWIEQEHQRIAQAEQQLQEIAEKIQQLNEQLQELPSVEERLQERQQWQKVYQGELQRIAAELGALRQQLEDLGRLELEREQLEERLAQQRKEQKDYELLMEAFGRNGIPKMILQSAVNWLEQEANRILSQLTYGRMHLRFALEMPTQSGTQRETLTIIVADELGDRPYENFSGGERFRIDFAVRLALARLLAHRAGAPLRTLIIDEGFGSQDKEGLEALVDAIRTVAKDFHRVLVVTHLDELRDQFPVLIEVTKGTHGSQLRVIGQTMELEIV